MDIGAAIANALTKFVPAVAIAALLFSLQPALLASAAVQNVAVRPDGGVVNAIQGDSDVEFLMVLENRSGRTIENISVEVGRISGFTDGRMLTGPTSIENNTTELYLFTVDIAENANYGNNYLPITFYYDEGGVKTELAKGSVMVNVSRNIAPQTDFNVPLLDMTYKIEGGDSLRAGETTILSITVTNRGNIMLQDVQVTLSLPEIMTLDNSVAVQYVSYLGVGESKTIKFPILVEKKVENKNYAITVKTSGLSKGNAAAFDRAVYLPVTGGEEKTANGDIEIDDISLPAEAEAGAEFTMHFSVTNKGEGDAENVKIEVLPEEGLVNRTKNVFIESVLKPGESKSYAVTFFSDKEKATRKSYSIRVAATVGSGEGALSASQYAGIFLTKEQTEDSIKNPQLLVDNYSYGADHVKAGERFNLTISLYNTGQRELVNIKVSLSADAGAFVPVGSSNAFFIERMDAKERVQRSLTMATNPNAEQMTTALNVAMTYEDGEGGVFQATDTIAIPVMQETSLTIDDIIAPPELYPGMQSGLDVRFYNTGKTQLRNLRVVAEGNFDTTESTSYYAGNMASGANDRYNFSFIPREEGTLDGKIVFTYDDPSGDMQTVEKEFSFQVMPPMEDMGGFMPDEAIEEPKSRTPLYVGGGAAVLLLVALIGLRRFLKRRKMRREIEIDEQL
jgi:uncharacterized repeat protein (TIGR01451 family)